MHGMILAAAFKDIHILYVLSFYVQRNTKKDSFLFLDIVGFKCQMVKRIVPVYGPCIWGIHAGRSEETWHDSLHASS